VSTIVITGASSGIGAEAARALAAQGWQIAVVGRNATRTKAVAADVGGRPYLADYDSLNEVRALAANLLADYPRIDVLANNAGGLVAKRGMTPDGHERTFQHNHLAPFLLTNLLLPRLLESEARVISTSSVMNLIGKVRLDDLDWKHRWWGGGWRAYGTSKLETVLFMRELAARTGLEAYSFHPGYVETRFGGNSLFIRATQAGRVSAAVGAAPLVHLASVDVVGAAPGTYFDQLTAHGRVARQGDDPAVATGLWQRSSELVGLRP